MVDADKSTLPEQNFVDAAVSRSAQHHSSGALRDRLRSSVAVVARATLPELDSVVVAVNRLQVEGLYDRLFRSLVTLRSVDGWPKRRQANSLSYLEHAPTFLIIVRRFRPTLNKRASE